MPDPNLFSMNDPAPGHVDLRALENGQRVEGAYAVRERELKRKKNGEPYLVLQLADASASVEGVRWDDAEALFELCELGVVVWVEGGYEVNERWGSKIKISSIRKAEPGEYDESELAPSSPVPVEALEAEFRKLLDEVAREPLAGLLDRFLGPDATLWASYREAPAAKTVHQAYRYGLLEHSLTVGLATAAAAEIFPGIDRELAITGAVLHDVGKLWAYTDDPLAIDLTDAGKLEGELSIGYYTIRREIEAMDEFDPELARSLLHIILAHHGRNEHGSPVEPRTREAVLVSAMDGLGGKLGSFDRVEQALPEGERWSGWDRPLGGSVYFPPRDES